MMSFPRPACTHGRSAFSFMLILVHAALPLSALADEEPGFQQIFDGKKLGDWDGDPRFWSVRDGAITGETTVKNPTEGNTFLVWRNGPVDDFELKLQFRIVGGNSGIQYRSREIDKWVISGYQADFDGANDWTGTLYEEKGRAVLARRGHKVVIDQNGQKRDAGHTADERKLLDLMRKEDWNEYGIVARDNHLLQMINGMVTVDVTDNERNKRSSSGLIALQLHAGPPMLVQFKNIRLKRLRPQVSATNKKVLFIAGRPSHGYGSHEHYAGCRLLASSLEANMPNFEVAVERGWPASLASFDDVDAIVMYMDGGAKHPAIQHIEEVDRLAKNGVGMVCIHYAVEVPRGKSGEAWLEWIGGYFEAHYSVNPHWTADFKKLPTHPITRGVRPFKINDEWYYHMRFRENMKGVTPILSDLPPASSLSRPDGPHSGNPTVRAAIARGESQHVAWATQRSDGGRGFGFTGGHYHWNWGDNDFRKLMLNAIVWTAKAEVPLDGVSDRPLTLRGLEANQDFQPPEDFNREDVRKRLRLRDRG